MNEQDLRDDSQAREYLGSHFDATLFIEAGAGTGKTSEVVKRIVALVARGHTTIDKLVAITFTEAAAAELRARVREALDAAILDGTRPNVERESCRAAVNALDNATISTIHAFCASLLRTYPLEAGLPPTFDTLDEIEQQLEFTGAFRAWFEAIGNDPVYGPRCRRALFLGLTPKQLSSVAAELSANYDLLTPTTTWESSPVEDAITLANSLGRDLATLWQSVAPGNEDHGFVQALRQTEFAATQLRVANEEVEALAALQSLERMPSRKVALGQWAGNKDDAKDIRDGLKGARDKAKTALGEYRACALAELLPSLRDFVLATVADRRHRGVATFQDLLVWARDLLRDNASARLRAQQRWTHVFVDEFQDTDPLQAQIVFYLCAEHSALAGQEWTEADLTPGKLCVVGDPKQSIYRFRRADIAVYEAVQEAMARNGGRRVTLSRNFRSCPDILGLVNAHFLQSMVAAQGIQPEYVPLIAHRDLPGPSVRHMGGPMPDVKQDEVWTAEAAAVAQAVQQIEGKWSVHDSGMERVARLGDICVLIPTRTNIRRLERAFEDMDIPYRLESGALILATQDVRELVACLRAIDDPSDEVALVAALRSPAYGCSDSELFLWAQSGGRFDYSRIGSGTGRVAEALEDLRERHDGRNDISVPDLIQRFLDDRLLTVAAFGTRRPRESWRRQRWVIDRARAFAATGRLSLRAFVDWVEGLERQSFQDSVGAQGEIDEDAVRVMTVHGSKGLEFPVVIMTGLASKPPKRPPCVIPDRLRNQLEIKVGSGGASPIFATSGHESAAAREGGMFEAEQSRLTYVAATRARDHLVISVFRKPEGAKPSHADGFARSLTAFSPATPLVVDSRAESQPWEVPATDLATPEEDLADEDVWINARAESLARNAAMPLRTATGLAHEPEPAEIDDDVASHRKGRGGTSLGRAVHGVLQSIDLASLTDLDQLAAVQATAQEIPHEAGRIAKLVRRVQESDAVQHAIRSPRYWREVPVGGMLHAFIVEGFIDLLYEDEGGLAIVDYKTDDVSGSELEQRLERYQVQGAAYAALVAGVTGRTVKRVTFVFAVRGEERSFDPEELTGVLESVLVASG